MTSRSEQDYLRCIYELQSKKGGPIRVGELTTALGISKSGISEMIKKLKKAGFVEYSAYGPISLTINGMNEARSVLRKHRLLEIFFARILGLHSSFHKEAHELEHVLSDEAEKCFERYLKHPKKCPDRNRIPEKHAQIFTLYSAPMSKPLRIVFSKLRKKEEVERIRALGIIHNEKCQIVKRISNGPIILKVKGSELILGKDVSSKIYVEVSA